MTRRALVVTHGGREEALVATAEAVRELELAGIEPVHDGGHEHGAPAPDLTGVEFAVVLGGDMAGAFDVYAAGVRESVYARASALATRDLQVLPSTFGDRAGLVGCASMALEQVLSPSAVDARLLERAPLASR